MFALKFSLGKILKSFSFNLRRKHKPRPGFIFKRNTPQLAAVGIKGMRIKLGLGSA